MYAVHVVATFLTGALHHILLITPAEYFPPPSVIVTLESAKYIYS